MVSSVTPFAPFLEGDGDPVEVTEPDEVQLVRSSPIAKVPAVEAFLAYPASAVRLRMRCWRATDVGSGWIPGRELEAPGALTA